MRASYDARLFEFGFAPKADLRRIGRGIGRESKIVLKRSAKEAAVPSTKLLHFEGYHPETHPFQRSTREKRKNPFPRVPAPLVLDRGSFLAASLSAKPSYQMVR